MLIVADGKLAPERISKKRKSTRWRKHLVVKKPKKQLVSKGILFVDGEKHYFQYPQKGSKMGNKKRKTIRTNYNFAYSQGRYKHKETPRFQDELRYHPRAVDEGYRQSLEGAADAIWEAFNWEDAKEGGYYWSSLYKRLIELSEGEAL